MNAGMRESLDPLMIQGIWPVEVEAARRRVQVGDIVSIYDHNRRIPKSDRYGSPVEVHITAKYPNLVQTSNGGAATYAQMALYYRGKRWID